MAVVIPREVLSAQTGKILKSLESKQIRMLKTERKFLLWKMRDVYGSLDKLSDDGKGDLYSALINISTDLDKLREENDDPTWTEALLTFFDSRKALKTFDKEIKKTNDIIADALKLQKRIAPKKRNAVADFESDLITDFNRTHKVVKEATFDDLMTEEAKSALRYAKLTLEEADKLGKVDELAKMLSRKEFGRLQELVEKIANRPTTTPKNPADGVTSPQVFKLDLSLDYERSSSGGYLFKHNKDGSSELTECFVFLPGSTTHIVKMWTKREKKKRLSLPWTKDKVYRFKVTVDDEEYWAAEENPDKLHDSKTFEHKGHTFTIKYVLEESRSHTWSTIVDGNSYPKKLSHKQWNEARTVDNFKSTLSAFERLRNSNY